MLSTSRLFVLLAIAGTSHAGLAQAGASRPPYDLRQALEDRLVVIEQQVVPAAEAMPETNYDYAPQGGAFAGVRTFGEQLKHLAAANWQLGSKAMGVDPPSGTHDEQAPASVSSKAEILDYLRGSFACLHRAAAAIDQQNAMQPIPGLSGTWQRTRLGLIVDALAHSSDHYGQIVEYLRANSIVPPASR
jgi:DinB family protein